MDRFAIVLCFTACFALGPSVIAQDLDLSWHTVDGGGGTAAGGTMTLTGSIGQNDGASVLMGGRYSFIGGFMPGVEEVHAALSADFNGDGVVDGADLGLLLGSWGDSDAGLDLNKDGIVNGADLGVFLGSWGQHAEPPDEAFVYEGFAYEPAGGSLNLYPAGGWGWTAAWAGSPPWTVTAPGLAHSDASSGLQVTGNAITASSAVGIRTLELLEPLGDSRQTVWVSMLAQRTSGSSTGTFLGLNLLAPRGSNPLLFMGQPFNHSHWGLDAGLPGTILVSSTPSTTAALLVMRVDFHDGADDVWLWVNPNLSSEPSITTADIAAPALGDFIGITQVRADVGAGGAGGSITGTLDELRLGWSFASVAPVVNNTPGPCPH